MDLYESGVLVCLNEWGVGRSELGEREEDWGGVETWGTDRGGREVGQEGGRLSICLLVWYVRLNDFLPAGSLLVAYFTNYIQSRVPRSERHCS